MASITTRHPGVVVIDVDAAEFDAEVRAELERAGMSLEEFVRLGRADALDDERLRDMWLMVGPTVARRSGR